MYYVIDNQEIQPVTDELHALSLKTLSAQWTHNTKAATMKGIQCLLHKSVYNTVHIFTLFTGLNIYTMQ